MCGIFGYMSFCDVQVERSRFEQSLLTMLHRGPDFQNSLFFANDTVALGHARLSIIDLAVEANQPMSVGGKYCVIFNGEIYNYIELKEELILKGYRFTTNSDTEVLVMAYDCWGEECVHHFNGMWGFAIYNTQDHTLFCSRDRFGVKPFNYYLDDKRFMFASEIKPLLAYDASLRRPNYNSIGLFCREGINGEISETWFDGVLRLLPGHNLTVRNNVVSVYRYYRYPKHTKQISFENAKEKFYGLFLDACKLRMRSDVPVGVTLSGGLDSSCIVAAVRQFHHAPLNTFTAHFPGYINDEYSSAQMTNRELGLNGNPVRVDYGGDLIATFSKLIFHLESGHNSPAIYPLWKVCAEAKKKVTVILEGQGADELLAGYIETFSGLYLIGLLKKFKVFYFINNFKKLSHNYSVKAILILAFRLFLPSKIKTLVRRYILKSEDILIGPLRYFRDVKFSQGKTSSLLLKALQKSHQAGLVNLLHYGDAISMAFSLESRLPFMDYRLVDFAMTLPDEYLIAEGKGKYIQRKSLEPILPSHINADVKKLGFPSPIKEFMERNKLVLEQVLLDKKTISRGIFNERKLREFIHSDISEPKSRFLFRLLSVELWFRLFIDTNDTLLSKEYL